MSSRTAAVRAVLLLTLPLAPLACGNESGPQSGFTSAGLGPITSQGGIDVEGTGSTDGATSDSDSGAHDDDDEGGGSWPGQGVLDVAANPDGDVDPDDCAELIEDADVGIQPADIIFVIDNSESMRNDIASVQAHMNQFSAQIAIADVDPRVVMVAGFAHNSDAGICIPPPLGSGLCPVADHNPPTYFRVDNWIGSHNALARIIEHYPEYQGNLRPTAATHVVVITDDESDVPAADFTNSFTALNPNFANFVFHTITNNRGNVYKALAAQTGGLVGNLDANEFQPIFTELASNVVEAASLACEFEIPEPGPGEVFNPDKVNVKFTDGSGGTLEIGRVESQAGCAGVVDGWYYDNPVAPETIVLCSQTCDSIQGYALAQVSMIFGCDTRPAG